MNPEDHVNRTLVIAAVIVVGLAYLAGFWPQHRQLTGCTRPTPGRARGHPGRQGVHVIVARTE